ncbi:MAG: TonB-dependent receptor [Bryobacteraceae bacterium]
MKTADRPPALPVLILFCAGCVLGQTSAPTGAVRGAVFDSSGAAIADVRVTARNEDTRTSRMSATDASGQYHLPNLAAGSYTLHLESPGFTAVDTEPFVISIGQTAEQRITMQPAGVTDRIDVVEKPDAVDTAAATASAALGGERIEEAPARSRNYLNFVLSAPGVSQSAGSSSQRTMTGVRAPLGDSGFTFGGMRARNNAILIDGTDNRDETTGGNRVAIGLEMVQEFRVAGSAVGAELGGAAGGLLNMVTRSGVNLWHGDFTFFTQNEALNARKAEVAGAADPRFRRYQPGVSVLGPVRRDRTFFATAIEHERESAEEWSDVPAGAVAIMNRALASPEYSRAAVRSVLRGLYGTSTRGTEFSTKVNHQIDARDTVSARYAWSRGRVRGEVQGPENFSDRSSQGSSLTSDHSLVANWLRVASPAVVNDVRVQVAGRSMELRPNDTGAMLEIPGVATLGEFYRLHSDRTERHYQFVESLNAALGRHRLSAGADAHRVTFDGALRNRFAGIFVFPDLAAFTAGRPDVFIQAFGDPHTRMSTTPIGLWLQDRWEARPGLHVEVGVRFDKQTMPAGLPASSNNFAPRVGLAWRPGTSRGPVVRAGYGLYYDRYPLAFLNDAIQKDGTRAFEQYAVGGEAVRAFTASRAGTLPAPLGGLGKSVYRASTYFPSTYSRKLTVGLEHGMGKDTTLSVEASHIRGFHLPRVRNASGALPPAYLLEQTSRSAYTGASISLNRRLSRELAYLFTYSVGRTRDDASDFDEHPLDPFDFRKDWALARQHQGQRFAASALFELPDVDVLPEWLQSGLESISVAPIVVAGSGRPINALLTTDSLRTGAYPISARPVGMARNPFLTRATVSVDLRVMKTIPVFHERALLQFGVESFNLTNRTRPERVSPYFAMPSGPVSSYGGSLESFPARQVQLLVQLEY